MENNLKFDFSDLEEKINDLINSKLHKSYRFNEKNKEETIILSKFIEKYGDKMDSIVFGSNKNRLSNEDKNIVLSVIQWLGTDVGINFLNECGFEKK